MGSGVTALQTASPPGRGADAGPVPRRGLEAGSVPPTRGWAGAGPGGGGGAGTGRVHWQGQGRGGGGGTPGGLMMDHRKASGSKFLLAAPVSTTEAPGLTLLFNGVSDTFSAGSDLQTGARHVPHQPTSGVLLRLTGQVRPNSPPPPPPCVTFRRVTVSLKGPGQSSVLPFACCVGSLHYVSRCGRCSCWCRFRVRGAQWLVCRGCAGCGGMCRLRVSGAQWLAYWGCAGCCGGRLTVLAVHTPPSSGRPQLARRRPRKFLV